MQPHSSETYFDATPSQTMEFEEQMGMPEMDDVKLRRTNPKRYDKRQDQTNLNNEHGHDSPIEFRYDDGPKLEASLEEYDWMFDRMVQSSKTTAEDVIDFCKKRYSRKQLEDMTKLSWDLLHYPEQNGPEPDANYVARVRLIEEDDDDRTWILDEAPLEFTVPLGTVAWLINLGTFSGSTFDYGLHFDPPLPQAKDNPESMGTAEYPAWGVYVDSSTLELVEAFDENDPAVIKLKEQR